MSLRWARTRLAGRLPGTAVLALLVLLFSPPAAASHPCDRYALDGLSLGMSPGTVKTTMGGTGFGTSIRLPDGEECTGVTYPGPPHEVYVEYDQRIDRRKAQVVRVRVSLPLSKETVEALVRRFGQPNAGADDLRNDLKDGGSAVWIDDTCGLVLTAFRPSSSWWAADGGAQLQVETFDLAQRADSPAKSRLAPKAARATIAPSAPAPPPASTTLMLQDDLALPDQEPAPVAAAAPAERPLIPTAKPAHPPVAVVQQPIVQPPATTAVPPIQPAPVPSAPVAKKAAPVPREKAEPVLVPVETPPTPSRSISSWHADSSKVAAPQPQAPVASAAPRTTSSAPSAAPAPARAPARAKAKDAQAERISFVDPVYPATAKWLGVKGHVTLGILVQPDGTVARSVSVINAIPPGRGFEEASIDAVRQWRYQPATRGGRAVASRLTVTVDIQ